MKEFKTLTQLELLTLAHDELRRRWSSHIDRNDRYRLAHNGKSNSIHKHWIDTYQAKMDELHEEIVRLETEEQKRIHNELAHEIAAEMERLGIN